MLLLLLTNFKIQNNFENQKIFNVILFGVNDIRGPVFVTGCNDCGIFETAFFDETNTEVI